MGFLRKFLGRKPEHEEHVHRDVDAPGWDAITGALEAIHPGIEPSHWGTVIRFRMGGPDPLDGLSAYRVDDPPHWHYVSFGLSELWDKQSEDASLSGWGFELTFRLARRATDDVPPVWPLNMLQNLARYVFSSGNPLAPGDHIDAYGPIALDEPTKLTALAFVEDPELPPVDTPNGRLSFVQLVGLTGDEYEAAQVWSTDGVLGLLTKRDRLLVTSLDRASIRTDPVAEAEIQEGVARDGSSMGQMNVDVVSAQAQGDALHVQLGATAVIRLTQVLGSRLRHHHGLLINGPSGYVGFQPGAKLAWHAADDGSTHVELPSDVLAEIEVTLRPIRGTYAVAGGRLVFDVEPTIVRNDDGKEIDRIG